VFILRSLLEKKSQPAVGMTQHAVLNVDVMLATVEFHVE
jgi:hypothetical protein